MDNKNMMNDIVAKGLKGIVASTALTVAGENKNDIFGWANVRKGLICGVGIYIWEEWVLEQVAASSYLGNAAKAGMTGTTASFVDGKLMA